MIHAYSPAKPSPLSRILMLADSPEGAPKLPSAFPSAGALSDEDNPLYDKVEVGKGTEKGGKGKRSLAAFVDADEKENTIRRKLKGPAAQKARAPPAGPAGPAKVKARPLVAGAPKASVSGKANVSGRPGASMSGKPGANGKPGPRRVPVNSAEAAPTAPGRRG
jgi:hypothetical protein